MTTATDAEQGSWNVDLAGAPEKELKVRIPLPQHIQLHTLKVLHGQTISATVRAALDAYFKEFDERQRRAEAQRRLDAWAGNAMAPPGADGGPPKVP